jgi:PTH1 family peptidyl-tRNA hydrolase
LVVAVGLGNPGDRYQATRHNLGKGVISDLSGKLSIPLVAGKGSFQLGIDEARELCLATLTTYMNTSGVGVRQVVERLGVRPEDLLVVCDDFYLPLGTIRIRKRGSDGGHNGLASIIYQLATEEFPRLRLGVGPVPPGLVPADFVLSEFAREEQETVRRLSELAVEAVISIASDGIDAAMNAFNRKVES